MTAFIIRRLLQGVMTLFIVITLVFFGIYAIGDPVEVLIHPAADQAEKERVAKTLGLDEPIWEQFFTYLNNAIQGDLGHSFVFHQPTVNLILERVPATLELALTALFIAVVVGLPLGMLAGLRPESVFAKTIMGGSILGFSLPNFWVGMMLIMVFSVQLGWLPSSGRGEVATLFGISSSLFTLDGLQHIAMPAFTLALTRIALVIRLAYAGMRENLLMDYVKFARAKGLSETRIIFVHVLKNILIPIVTVLGMEFGGTIAFTVVTETVFAWPGMGKLLIDSINLLDRPVVVAYLLIVAAAFITINFLVDILYSLLDPRVRLTDSNV